VRKDVGAHLKAEGVERPLLVTDKGLGGCTRVGCFYCPADGSRDCYAMRTSGKAQQVDVDKIQMKCNRGAEGWCK